ncbi:MAG: ABC transporter substrate-binding protein, partial [Proteobacteria bacterium]|nr:ABC transporter substrate-binding protein [Pseudomonadota bacterium]
MKKVLVIFGALLLVVVMGGPQGWTQEPIVIGGVAPLSAPGAAESGAEMKIAME